MCYIIRTYVVLLTGQLRHDLCRQRPVLGAMILAGQGADVIKVEAPGTGDHSRRAATRRGGIET